MSASLTSFNILAFETSTERLSVALAKEGLGAAATVLGRFSRSTKATQAVLPVFFGQADACIASRRTMETMTELNPQLAKKLRVLLEAPKMVNVFLGCRKTYPARSRSVRTHAGAISTTVVAARFCGTDFASSSDRKSVV